MEKIPVDPAETQKLLKQVRSGKPGAFDRLFERYRAYLRKLVEMRLDPKLSQRLDASDVIQETQIEAAQRLEDYLEREPVPFHIWLRQIAHDQLLMARRRHMEAARRAVTREVPLPARSSLELAQQLLAGGSTPSQHIAKKEQAQCVRKALAELPDLDREIVLMRNFEQLSHEEIGYVLQISPDAAKMRYVRALLRLSKILHENGLTESQI